MLREKQIIIISESEEHTRNTYVNLSINHSITGIISKTADHKGFPVSYSEYEEVEKERLGNYLFVLASDISGDYLVEIINKFRKDKLEVIDNWIPYWLLESCEIDFLRLYEFFGRNVQTFQSTIQKLKQQKKILMIHGNCHTHVMNYYLKHNNYIKKNYFLCKMPQLWNSGHVSSYQKMYDIGFWGYIDVFVTQIIDINNRFTKLIATQEILPLLNEQCKVIKITNPYLDAYYPQFRAPGGVDHNQIKAVTDEEGKTYFDGRIDYNVARLVAEHRGYKEILDYVCNKNVYNKEYLYNIFFAGIAEMKRREHTCDIKISDFLEENFDRDLCFISANHPTEIVITEILKRLLSALAGTDMGNADIYSCDVRFTGVYEDVLIMYPSVLKCLGLEKYYNLFYKLPSGEKVPFEEYMSTYIRTVFPCTLMEERS